MSADSALPDRKERFLLGSSITGKVGQTVNQTKQNNRCSLKAVLQKAGISQAMIEVCAEVFRRKGWISQLEQLEPVNMGMTNRLFYFVADGREYLLRIAGEGSEHLVDRQQENWIYHKLEGRGITDHYVYMDPATGLKITEYISDARCCDIQNMEEVRRCIRHLAHFHDLKLMGETYFDLFEKLAEYERVCAHDIRAFFPDYDTVRENVMKLKDIIAGSPKSYCISHVDPVPDNFLIRQDKIFLIDWEYAAMADPHMDIAMFCIYAGYQKEQIDQVIGFYFKDGCPDAVRRKIYCYVACSGLLWTVWCEIKRDSGVLFEEYQRLQYQYAIDFYDYVMGWEVSDER